MSTHYARFRHLAIERAKPAPTVEQLAAIEDLLGARLPTSFREFLQVANGGYLEYVIDVPFGDGKSEPLSFCGIFSAEDGDFCDETFVGEIRSSREHQKIPPGILPFARTGGGSMVYLDLSPEGNGRVVAFVEGLPEWTGLRTKSGYFELASSFDEYVDKLRIDREVVIDHLTHDAKTEGHIHATEEWLDIGMPSWREDSELVGAVIAASRQLTGRG
jgi:cell wall assembly regulator SMI1